MSAPSGSLILSQLVTAPGHSRTPPKNAHPPPPDAAEKDHDLPLALLVPLSVIALALMLLVLPLLWIRETSRLRKEEIRERKRRTAPETSPQP